MRLLPPLIEGDPLFRCIWFACGKLVRARGGPPWSGLPDEGQISLELADTITARSEDPYHMRSLLQNHDDPVGWQPVYTYVHGGVEYPARSRSALRETLYPGPTSGPAVAFDIHYEITDRVTDQCDDGTL